MTVIAEEQVDPPPTMSAIKKKCVNCLKGPNLIKTLIIIICTAVVIQQISTCVMKLIKVPITTYTHFDFNKSIMYPSVTFCREPPYKFGKMYEHGLYGHPLYSSEFRNYNFSHPLDELWDEITYTADEFFSQYGLNEQEYNVEIKPTMGFVLGRCHTFVPKEPLTRATRATGYSFSLQHNAEDVAMNTGTSPPGYHVYVHYTREPFTEVDVYNGGLVDYLFINTGETVEVKLTVDVYKKLSRDDDPCTTGHDYSANNCTSKYVWDKVGEHAGCSGPWMIISDLPRCDNNISMINLISDYMNTYNNHDCTSCPRFCRALLYNAFVTSRHTHMWDSAAQRWTERIGDAELQSQVFMYFNTMMVTVHEERYNYDWNLFLSDLGGSIGFLLGLSVISLMTVCGKVWSSIIRPYITPKVKRADSISSTVTAEINDDEFNKSDDYKKCNEWTVKNIVNDFI